MFVFENKCKVLSGKNAIESIGFEIRAREIKNPLVISEKIIKDLGIIKKIFKNLDYSKSFIKSIFIDVEFQATVDVVEKLLERYKNNNHDSIIAIGRNAVISTAKALKYLINTDSNSFEDLKKESIKKDKVQLFTVPVFLGCTEEATSECMLFDTNKKRSYIIKSNLITPNAVFLDKRNVDVIPPSIVVNTSGYAFLIAFEAYAAKDSNEIIKSYAEASLKLINDNLDIVLKKPSKLNLYLPLMEAVVYSGVAKSSVNINIFDVIAKVISRIKQIPKEFVMFTMFVEQPDLFIEDKKSLTRLMPLFANEEIACKILDEDKPDFILNIISAKFKSITKTYSLPKGLYGLGVQRSEFQKIAEEVKFDIAARKIYKNIDIQEIQEYLNKLYSEE